MSLSARRAWIEIKSRRCAKRFHASLSARRAWIEIADYVQYNYNNNVALRKESVDRNDVLAVSALLEVIVALRKESVDRNHVVLVVPSGCWLSLSARRAWIEIFYYADKDADWVVALRKESVDRNVFLTLTIRNVPVALRKESVDRNMLYDTSSLMKCQGRSPQGERG